LACCPGVYCEKQIKGKRNKVGINNVLDIKAKYETCLEQN